MRYLGPRRNVPTDATDDADEVKVLDFQMIMPAASHCRVFTAGLGNPCLLSSWLTTTPAY